MVEPGRGICLMPEDIHSIHTTGNAPTRHLHMYGLALEKLDNRKGYDMETGTVSALQQELHEADLAGEGLTMAAPLSRRRRSRPGWRRAGTRPARCAGGRRVRTLAHLFWAVPCPLSQARAARPRADAAPAVRTWSAWMAARARERLAELLRSSAGPTSHVLEGGTQAWAAAGYRASSPASTSPPRPSVNGWSTTTARPPSARRSCTPCMDARRRHPDRGQPHARGVRPCRSPAGSVCRAASWSTGRRPGAGRRPWWW